MFPTTVHPTDLPSASIAAPIIAHDLAKEVDSKLIVCFIAHPPFVSSGESLANPITTRAKTLLVVLAIGVFARNCTDNTSKYCYQN